MKMRQIVHGTFGTLVLAASVIALVRPTTALSPDSYSPAAAHLVQEQAAGGVFIGLMALWCARHRELNRPVHLALLVFTFLFAAIHWMEFVHARRTIASPLVNSIPFLLLLASTPFRGVASPNSQDS
jgi:hypothetical protein